jgi:hypothetical protein
MPRPPRTLWKNSTPARVDLFRRERFSPSPFPENAPRANSESPKGLWTICERLHHAHFHMGLRFVADRTNP